MPRKKPVPVQEITYFSIEQIQSSFYYCPIDGRCSYRPVKLSLFYDYITARKDILRHNHGGISGDYLFIGQYKFKKMAVLWVLAFGEYPTEPVRFKGARELDYRPENLCYVSNPPLSTPKPIPHYTPKNRGPRSPFGWREAEGNYPTLSAYKQHLKDLGHPNHDAFWEMYTKATTPDYL
ncbi:MAG: hypothetical protein COA47_10360 [Robiginitomaculum sp.]|nr:MAG: hypothetical protein COA47_10360 [Robiginitomaculum sp.]